MTQIINKIRPHTPQALVSVIIPMYKVEEHLPNCIEQLLAQTYKQLELIFVDDASPDRASELVRLATPRLEAKGFVVKLLCHERNQGVAVARNTALDAATGEYIYSFDADDAMAPNLIERLIVRAYQTGVDIVGCDWNLRYEDKDRRMYQPDVKTGQELFECFCYGVAKWNVWLFLVRRELFSSGKLLRFTPGDNMGEDMMMMSLLALRAQRVSIVSEPLYYYVKTNADAQTANYKAEHWNQVDRNLRTLEREIQALQDEHNLRMLNFLKLNLKLPLLISVRQDDYKRWSQWYSEANGYIMQNPKQSWRIKLLQFAASRSLWSLVRLYNLVVTQWLYSILYK